MTEQIKAPQPAPSTFAEWAKTVEWWDFDEAGRACSRKSARYMALQAYNAAHSADPDGDAFRTAARLGLTLRFDGGCAQSATPGTPSAYEVVNKQDRAAGMRQAVDQAAAVIAAGGQSHNDSMAKLARPAIQAPEGALTDEQIGRVVEKFQCGADWTDDDFNSAMKLARAAIAAERQALAAQPAPKCPDGTLCVDCCQGSEPCRREAPSPAEGDAPILARIAEYAENLESGGVDASAVRGLLLALNAEIDAQPNVQPKGTPVAEVVVEAGIGRRLVWNQTFGAWDIPEPGTKLYTHPVQSPAPAHELADEQIVAAWDAWPHTAITSRRRAIEFVRSLPVPSPAVTPDAARYQFLRSETPEAHALLVELVRRRELVESLFDAAVDAAMASRPPVQGSQP